MLGVVGPDVLKAVTEDDRLSTEAKLCRKTLGEAVVGPQHRPVHVIRKDAEVI